MRCGTVTKVIIFANPRALFRLLWRYVQDLPSVYSEHLSENSNEYVSEESEFSSQPWTFTGLTSDLLLSRFTTTEPVASVCYYRDIQSIPLKHRLQIRAGFIVLNRIIYRLLETPE